MVSLAVHSQLPSDAVNGWSPPGTPPWFESTMAMVPPSLTEMTSREARVVSLTVFLMMYGFQQIVAQTERHDNFVVHGLAPPERKWVISLQCEAEAHGFQ